MSGHKYITNPNYLFEDNDVDNVNTFRTRISPSQPAAKPYGGHIAELERQRQTMLERQREIEQRTLDSSARSLSLLLDSEKIGLETAEELARQGEQLQNTNKRLDVINTDLNYSQKHLNGIKSVFSGIKNYISGKSEIPPKSQPPISRVANGSSSKINNTSNNSRQMTSQERYSSHPSTRLRDLDQQQVTAPVTDSQRVNEILDANLDEMLQNITRLKGFGVALGNEIEKQNILIDTIQDKVEHADIKIGKQNKQMNKLLGK